MLDLGSGLGYSTLWLATALEPGGTMATWFLLVDALTGRSDLHIAWITQPPIGFAVKRE